MTFFNRIEKFGSNICFIDENKKKVLYNDVFKKSETLCKNLQSRNLIVVLAENQTEFIVGYMGFFRKGLVQMLLDSKITNNLLKDLIKTYVPKYIFLPTHRKDDIENYEVMNKMNNYVLLKLNKDNFYSINNDLALLLSTSGSTGSKKFVRISYENIYQNTKDIIDFLKIDVNHRTVTTMPPFYTYGLSVINTHLVAGASIVITNSRVTEKAFWKLINDQKVTSFAGVPYFYEILNKIRFDQLSLPHLKYFTQAGGALRKDLIEYFLKYSEKNKKQFIVMYGQTEATARMTYLPYEMSKKKIGSVGIPIPGGKIHLRNDKSSSDKSGEIIYEGKNVSMGYAKNIEDLSKENENQGILETGDLATKDNDGYLYIVGRKSRDVKLFGHRISLDEIEKILLQKGYNCLCCGSDNKVTIFHIDETYNREVLQHLARTTNIHLNCFKLKHIKKFPLNDNGKISYKKLEKLL